RVTKVFFIVHAKLRGHSNTSTILTHSACEGYASPCSSSRYRRTGTPSSHAARHTRRPWRFRSRCIIAGKAARDATGVKPIAGHRDACTDAAGRSSDSVRLPSGVLRCGQWRVTRDTRPETMWKLGWASLRSVLGLFSWLAFSWITA